MEESLIQIPDNFEELIEEHLPSIQEKLANIVDKNISKSKEEQLEITDDPVEHPSHYTYGSIECIDYITDKQFNFCLGNAVKYITRAGHKINAIEDLKKAAWYINKEIEVLQNANS